MTGIGEIKRRDVEFQVLSDVYRFARLGRQSISPDDELRLRRYGIYTQRPAEDGFFMVRLRIPGGELNSFQLRTIGEMANEHGRGLADITVRQNIQLHWVRIESLPDILGRLRIVALSTTETCGAGVRNIVNCPVSGADAGELYDTTDLIRQVNDFFTGNGDFSDLPRKFKIAITGCELRCVYPEINDIGIFAVPDSGGRVAFRARVGGGLSTTPRFSRDLGVLAEPEEAVELCAAIASVFRDEGNREDRKHARLKFVIEQGDVPRFRDEVDARLGRRLRRAPEPDASPIGERDRSHLGIHAQREKDLSYVGISIPGGRTSGFELKRLAALAQEYGSGRIRTTNTQNVILLDVPSSNLAGLKRELDLSGFDYEPSWARKGIIACTGIQFCKLAISETKNRAAQLDEQLAGALDLDDPVRISVTGCPNSCGQHRICDVGLEGTLATIDGVKQESFHVFLGGGVGVHETFGRRIGARIPSDELAESLTRLFTHYKDRRTAGETFQEFCLRHSDEKLAEYLSPPPDGIDAVAAHDLMTGAAFVGIADKNG